MASELARASIAIPLLPLRPSSSPSCHPSHCVYFYNPFEPIPVGVEISIGLAFERASPQTRCTRSSRLLIGGCTQGAGPRCGKPPGIWAPTTRVCTPCPSVSASRGRRHDGPSTPSDSECFTSARIGIELEVQTLSSSSGYPRLAVPIPSHFFPFFSPFIFRALCPSFSPPFSLRLLLQPF